MTREEAIAHGKEQLEVFGGEHREFIEMSIKALEQEPRKDEVILTKEEYGELASNEFDNGYAKGYREALEQEPIIKKIKAEIDSSHNGCGLFNDGIDKALDIIDKYKVESEEIV